MAKRYQMQWDQEKLLLAMANVLTGPNAVGEEFVFVAAFKALRDEFTRQAWERDNE